MSRLPHLAQRLFNTPVAIHPQKAEIVVAALADRLGVTHLFRDGGTVALQPKAMLLDEADRAPDRAYDVVAGIAVIPVAGTLVQKLGSLRPFSGMTGYDGVRMNFLAALNDEDVDAIVLDIDSPGGEVAGCFDLADLIFASRGKKPIWSILNENAFSAAYAIASAADRITVPRTGGTGSIGVICMHVDMTQALSKAGVVVTLIRYGAHKAEGSEYESLSEGALARMQSDIDQMGNLFCDTVARNRKLRPSVVRGFEARTFLGGAGVDVGLADAVLAPDAAFAELARSL
ncbi:bacteriophage minor capsid protein C [Gluconacetobacter johannae DSM 13595]|uniref:S49 family peptidase n=1 Tax=Gluconacetobacter johannae TaxID=112140 RepID=A0A7W4J8X8_9PROT|nr:S49 family peptidase [Gluconacetobacter johannae]MBB2176766.1 S49 family peptidase [Gluconacetobacter johannae]GBQ84122.1 bacteriophage minor capsid protein C [Gluconacetobacter johannae DSM 13595]